MVVIELKKPGSTNCKPGWKLALFNSLYDNLYIALFVIFLTDELGSKSLCIPYLLIH